jgi:hypothetical protein
MHAARSGKRVEILGLSKETASSSEDPKSFSKPPRATTFRPDHDVAELKVPGVGLRADMFERGSRAVQRTIRDRFVVQIGACDWTELLDKAAFRDFVLEIVRRMDTGPGSNVLPRRWVVERTLMNGIELCPRSEATEQRHQGPSICVRTTSWLQSNWSASPGAKLNGT